MKVNGQIIELKKPVMLKEYLLDSGYDIRKIAVELNGNIVSKNSLDEVELNNDDNLEIVRFVGGG